jgi:hypothetical protein
MIEREITRRLDGMEDKTVLGEKLGESTAKNDVSTYESDMSSDTLF